MKMKEFVFYFFAFLIGSIPFSYIITKKFFNKDITHFYDNNPGATNAFRVAGIKAGIPSLILDISKGYFTIYIANTIFYPQKLPVYVCAFMVVLGHAYSIFLKLKGGKSIASTMGILLFLYGVLPVIFFCLGTFLGLLVFRKDNIGTVLGIWSVILFAVLFNTNANDIIFLSMLCLFLTYRQLRTPSIPIDIIKVIKNTIKKASHSFLGK
ncbi:protein of unknown function DUF205 [Caldicellulosiruptor kronotskyensis 2002]|uniref:Glycerol-3-phosphate acyltransferase n=2 Tax=Caldicellulosiruptor TaxID=44000 RepID=E4SE64_CALK2|nr:protein of unknown function DUF205 [Caldicellulosiruptor kronotskyensis 2002]